MGNTFNNTMKLSITVGPPPPKMAAVMDRSWNPRIINKLVNVQNSR